MPVHPSTGDSWEEIACRECLQAAPSPDIHVMYAKEQQFELHLLARISPDAGESERVIQVETCHRQELLHVGRYKLKTCLCQRRCDGPSTYLVVDQSPRLVDDVQRI